MNVVYIKQQNWFIHIARKFIDFSDKKFFGNGEKNFYQAQLADNIEMRGWDNFWDKIEEGKEFLTRLDICRQIFKKNCKEKLGLEKHYKSTLARDQWEDIYHYYYLYYVWATDTCKELCPKTEQEYEAMLGLNKASFYYTNPDSFGSISTNLHCYDISSSHIGFYYRKKFPSTPFVRTNDAKEISKIIKDDFYCWYGEFQFSNLHYKKDRENFKVDLGKFGYVLDSVDEEVWWNLTLTNIDLKWFKNHFEWDECYCEYIYYAEQKEIQKDYAKMIEDLYIMKDGQKKGTFAKEIYKFRAELPFGQPIKRVVYDTELAYNNETDEFEEVESEGNSFKQIQFKISKRGFPMYWGLWDVAYSRLEFYSMIEKIGFNKVIYGDTDSVKFYGEEGIKIIEEHNVEIEKEIKTIQKKRNMTILPKIGRWLNEGDLVALKAIGVKWYATLDQDSKIDVKASGADPEAIKNYLETQKAPLYKFCRRMKVENMFKSITPSKEHKYGIVLEYYNEMDDDFKKDISGRGTILYDKNEIRRIYEEGMRHGA